MIVRSGLFLRCALIVHRRYRGSGLAHYLVWVTVGVAVGAACSQRLEQQERNAVPALISVQDDDGAPVTLRSPAQRIVSLAPALTEVLFAVGCGSQIVLRDQTANFPAAVRQIPAVDAFRFALQQVVQRHPDLVLFTALHGAKVSALRELGVQVARFDPQRVADIPPTMKRLVTLCGGGAAAVEAFERSAGQLERLERRVRPSDNGRLRIYVEVDGSNLAKPWTAGPGSLLDDLIVLAGGKNVFEGLARPYAAVSTEAVLKSSPDVILLPRRARGESPRQIFLQRPGWTPLTDRPGLVIIDSIAEDLLFRPGPRVVQGAQQLQAALSQAIRQHGRLSLPTS